MLIAMGLAAFLCIFIGVFPGLLYSILPYAVVYEPYTVDHVVGHLLLLLSGAAAFIILLIKGYYPREQKSVNLDVDWFYRKGVPALISWISAPLARLNSWAGQTTLETVPNYLVWFGKNPMAALGIVKARIMLALPGSDYKEEIKKRMETENNAFPSDMFNSWSISSAVSLVLVFLAAYLAIFYF